MRLKAINWLNIIFMLNLSIEHINESSPYTVVFTQHRTYSFKTDEGVCYDVGFVEDHMLGIDNVYQFFIEAESTVSQHPDTKIQSTVYAILEEFFNNGCMILDYICDTSDGRQSVRNRLFSRWFRMYPGKSGFTIHSISANSDGVLYYAAVVIRNDNPDYDLCMEEVDKFEDEMEDKLQ